MDAIIQKEAAFHRFRRGLSTCIDKRPSRWIDRGKVTSPSTTHRKKRKEKVIHYLSIDIIIFLFPPPTAAHTKAISPATSPRWDPAA